MEKCTFADCFSCGNKNGCAKDEKQVADALQIIDHDPNYLMNPDLYDLVVRATELLNFNPNACDEVEAIRLVLRLKKLVGEWGNITIAEGIHAICMMLGYGIFLDSDTLRADRVSPFSVEAIDLLLANSATAATFLLQCSNEAFKYLICREVQGFRAQHPVVLPHRPPELYKRNME